MVDASTLPVSKAQLLAFGNYRGPAASRDAEAQRFFDQGLVFGWGFNFAEAARSFRAASQLDPACALCRWGIAWALGPSINHDMRPADVPVALDAIVQARSTAAPGSRDRALIDALAARYSELPGSNVGKLAVSYSAAMRTLAERYADDADIAVLAAEAGMNAHAYDYWRSDGKPRDWTPQIIAWLDRALSLAPLHPGAHHYRIHLFEDSPQPERALASAQQLGTLAPMVGHLVHMPSHIYFRLGRYREAVAANEGAVKADRDYAAATGATSDYAIHNLHFLWVSALWSGDSEIAIDAADQLAAAVSASADNAHDGTRQHFLAAPWLTQVRLLRCRPLLARVDAIRARDGIRRGRRCRWSAGRARVDATILKGRGSCRPEGKGHHSILRRVDGCGSAVAVRHCGGAQPARRSRAIGARGSRGRRSIGE
jgi:tetratricopeptide (TPR) repeat protein